MPSSIFITILLLSFQFLNMTKPFFTIVAWAAIMLSSCSKSEDFAEFEAQLEKPTAYASIPDDKRRTILDLDEPTSTVINQSKRWFNTTNIVRVAPIAKNELQLNSYSVKPIKDVRIYAHLAGYDEAFLIMQLDSIPRFSQLEFTPSFLDKKATYKTKGGGYITFTAPSIPSDMTFSVESPDPHYQMLKKIDVSWNIRFSNFDWNESKGPEEGSWLELKAIYAREWVVFATNFAYILSTPEFKSLFFNYEAAMGYKLHNNNQVPYTEEGMKDLFNLLRGNHTFNCGRTNIGGGLGGGGTWGVDHWNFYGQYGSFHGYDTFIHEFAHCKGFSHDSNVNQSWCFPTMVAQLHNYLVHQPTPGIPYETWKLLDFGNPEVYGKYCTKGVNKDWLVSPFNAESSVAKYLKSNPVKK